MDVLESNLENRINKRGGELIGEGEKKGGHSYF